jgi:soluble lytic murein transglycosylase-like protein
MDRGSFNPASLVLGMLLACGALQPEIASLDLATPDPAHVPTPAVHGPNDVEWVEARFLSHQTGLSREEVRAAAEAVVAESTRTEVPLDLVLAVIQVESGYHNFARSRVGALGLMQIMPDTGRALAQELGIEWHGNETLFQPVDNVRMGTHYLGYLHRRFGTFPAALAAYNWGPARIDRRLRRGSGMPELYVSQVYSRLQSPDAL